MRTAAVFLVLAAAVSAPAFAQETQQEIAERLFREQQDQRKNALDKVMTAPARAFDHADSDPYHSIGPEEAAPAPPTATKAAASRSKAPGGKFPWLLVACLLPAIPLAVLAFEKGRKWWRELR